MSRTFTPHSYQTEAIEHLQQTRRAALWMPMGGGKTVSVLTALEALDLVEPVYPVLVLAPLRVARTTWPDEIRKWAHTNHLKVSVITGNAVERKFALNCKADIYTMNYDNLVWLTEQCKGRWPFKTVISDESTRLKSFRLRQGGKRAHALSKVAHDPVNRFYNLTGTPAPNGLKDLWGQCWFLDEGKRLGASYTAFNMRWFFTAPDGYGTIPFGHSQGEIEDLLKDICLTVKGMPVDAPIVSPVYIELDGHSRALYDQMEEELFAYLEEHGVEAANAAVKVNKCLQIASGLLIDEDKIAHEVHRLKIDALESIVEEAAGAPVLVAYNFVFDKERLLKHFKQARVLDANPKTVHDWNAGKIPILLAHPASAGHGLNLADGGNILARFGFDWNLENFMQVLERIGPMRQKQAGYDRPVFDYPIIARHTADEMVLDRLRGKRSVQEVLLAALERRAHVR